MKFIKIILAVLAIGFLGQNFAMEPMKMMPNLSKTHAAIQTLILEKAESIRHAQSHQEVLLILDQITALELQQKQQYEKREQSYLTQRAAIDQKIAALEKRELKEKLQKSVIIKTFDRKHRWEVPRKIIALFGTLEGMAQAQEAGLMRLDKALRLPPAIPYWDFDLLLRHMPSEELLEKINQQQKVIDFDKELAAESGGSPLKFLEEQKEQLIDSVFKERLLALDNHSLFTILKTAEHLEQIIFDETAYQVLIHRLLASTHKCNSLTHSHDAAKKLNPKLEQPLIDETAIDEVINQFITSSYTCKNECKYVGVANPCFDPDEFYNRHILHRLAQGMIASDYNKICKNFGLNSLASIHTPEQANNLLILMKYCIKNRPFNIENEDISYLKRHLDRLPEDIRCHIPVVVLPVPQPAPPPRPAPGPSSAYTILGYIVDAALSLNG